MDRKLNKIIRPRWRIDGRPGEGGSRSWRGKLPQAIPERPVCQLGLAEVQIRIQKGWYVKPGSPNHLLLEVRWGPCQGTSSQSSLAWLRYELELGLRAVLVLKTVTHPFTNMSCIVSHLHLSLFLATLVALHFTLVSKWVSEWVSQWVVVSN